MAFQASCILPIASTLSHRRPFIDLDTELQIHGVPYLVQESAQRCDPASKTRFVVHVIAEDTQ
jgi:hypothetical protein